MIQLAMQSKSLMQSIKKVQIDDVANELEHLNDQQMADIKWVLILRHRKLHIGLEPEAKPKHAWPYPVPVIHF
jgi:hypothetical protein